MRRSVNLVIIALLVLLFVASSYALSAIAQTSSPYVYRIKASQCLHQPTSRQLTGFRLQGQSGIVTALHGVIDCDSISAVTDDIDAPYFNDLSIHKVDIERDSALLLSNELRARSLSEGLDVVSNLDYIEPEDDFLVIGYPLELSKQRAIVRAPIVVRTILDNLIPFSSKKAMRVRNSPNLKISVLHIQASLLPGDSGAPALNNAGQVVGVGNGGLEKGSADIAWLIPITDIEWRSISRLDIQDELNELKQADPQLALSFSSTYPGAYNPTSTPSPTWTYRPTATPTRVYRPAPIPGLGKNCDCSANLYDCSNFASQADAQACYWNCGAQRKGDIHRLDLDADRDACEDFNVYQTVSEATSVPTATPFPTYTPRPTYTLITTFTPFPITYAPTPTSMPPMPIPTSVRGIGSTYVNSIDGATYVYVPSGEFVMGSTDTQVNFADRLCQTYFDDCDPTWFRNQQPHTTVYLDSYWIMKTEVSNAQYRKFIDAGGYNNSAYWSYEGWLWRGTKTEPRCWYDSNYNHHQQPAICISWYEAEAYANWLSAMAGLDFGLPTEAEWEKAARGTDGRHFPWGNYWESYRANYCDVNCTNESSDRTGNDGYQYTSPVGSYPSGASPYGALDMAGNVWEWTADWYTPNYYYNLSKNNPTGPAGGLRRTARGGAWNHAPYHVRTANRDGGDPGKQVEDVGFRLRLYLDR